MNVGSTGKGHRCLPDSGTLREGGGFLKRHSFLCGPKEEHNGIVLIVVSAEASGDTGMLGRTLVGKEKGTGQVSATSLSFWAHTFAT